MANRQIIDYVQTELGKGFSEEQIRQALVKAGWKAIDIDDAFKSVKAIPQEVKLKKPDPEQVLKEITKEGIKEPKKTERSWFNRKKLLIYLVIGLLLFLLVIYYIYEFVQSLK